MHCKIINLIINNHFKCCGDGNLNLNNDSDEEMRRLNASNLLKQYIDNNLSNKNVIVLGDLNDDIAESSANNVFQTILDDTDNYRFVDMDIASGGSSNWSYPTWPSLLDHILITNELFDNDPYVEVIRIDDFMDGGFSQYDQNVSDHRPVALKLAIESNPLGDMNNDGLLNVIDVVSVVNIILFSLYLDSADMNLDGAVNVLDVIQLLNIILNN